MIQSTSSDEKVNQQEIHYKFQFPQSISLFQKQLDICQVFQDYINISENIQFINFFQESREKQVLKRMILDQSSSPVVPVHESHPFFTPAILQNYQKVLSYSNLKLHQEISHRNVRIAENEYIHQIFTKSGSNNPEKNRKLPHMVFLHGFGGTSITAIRLFEHLHEQFQAHALDLYGFGYSSRGNFSDDFTPQQVIYYYVEAIELWRKAINIEKFYLIGHSFGGYIAACYAMKYPERISHLFLVSPAGTSERRQFNTQGRQITCKQKIFFGLAEKVYNWNIRPSRVMTNFFVGNKFLNSILINRLKIPQEQQNDWREYFYNVNSQQTSSQVGFYKIFEWPLRPPVTIQDIIRKNRNNFNFDIDFYFGDSDWMPKEGAQRLIKDGIKGVKMTIIPDAGHQIVFDNSAALCQEILDTVGNKKKI